MDTKRCARCHKLVRADAQTCSRCGYHFSEKRLRTAQRARSTPSLLPASPHRAGHYSGLHPEDQPYDSSMIVVQRPPLEEVETRRLSQHEPDYIILPTVDAAAHTKTTHAEQISQTKTRTGRLTHAAQIPTQVLPPMAPKAVPDATPRLLPMSAPVSSPSASKSTPPVAMLSRKERPVKPQGPVEQKGRIRSIISITLIISCIFFLFSIAITVWFLMQHHPTSASAEVIVSPNILRPHDTFTVTGHGLGSHDVVTFTYDIHNPIVDARGQQLQAKTDGAGTFSVQIRVPDSWTAGKHMIYANDHMQGTTRVRSLSAPITIQQAPAAPPHLGVSTATLNLGSDRAGTTSTKDITLTNTGGGQIAWQQSSNASWLTAEPANNSYSFAGSELVQVVVNRGNLVPRAYTGKITFTQKNSNNSAIVTVSMTVTPAPAALNISQTTLTFSATSNQNPDAQAVVLHNSGGQALNWQAAASTNDGANWLFVDKTQGQLDPTQSQSLLVIVHAKQLVVGAYQGTVALTGGANATITVMLTVVAPGNLVISPSSLTFNTVARQGATDGTATTIALQNSGGRPLSWSCQVTTSDQNNWLLVTPLSQDSVGAGEQTTVTVNVDASALQAGAYQGQLTFTAGDQTQQVLVALTVVNPPIPEITIQPMTITFTTPKGTNPASQTLALSNTGAAMLNWRATEDKNEAGVVLTSISPAQGSLAPRANVALTVRPNSKDLDIGTFTTTITISDSDAGITVNSQKIAVTVIIQKPPQPTLSVSSTDLQLDMAGPNGNTQSLTISNTGSVPLHWTIAPDTSVSWLSMDTTSGTLGPGTSQTLHIHGDSGHLAHGAYQVGLVVSNSDGTSRTVSVTFTT